MKAFSNVPLPPVPERWKEGQFAYYFNHKDNGIQKEEDEGRRYEADFTIIKAKEITKADVEKILVRSILDESLEQKVIDNIEVEGKSAIDIIKTYIITKATSDKVAEILIEHPIDSKEVKLNV
jgi:hypothetical protein